MADEEARLQEALLVEIAVLKERITGMKGEISKQALEYERRLQELNHAHQQQQDRNAQYVSREAWEARNAMIDAWRRDVDKQRWVAAAVASLIAAGVSILAGVIR